jgi:bifunctional UDP-N-acetylglucosamine pyrophosphorylase/glucosamine-1-phosphate N-acetyltransferase
MSKKSLAVVILAAGEGKRMKSDKPKVMHGLAGLPMISWLLKSVESLKPQKIIVVVGPDMDDLAAAVKPHKTVIQETRNGTAGALMTALPLLQGFTGDVMVLLGDAPLIRPETLKYLLATRNQEPRTGMAVLGIELPDPTGYGRMIMSQDGILQKIVEEKDASPSQKNIHLVNSGAMCIDGARLKRWLNKVDNKNAQKEFYMTDLPEIAAQDGAVTKVAVCPDPSEVSGCNTRIDLAYLEKTLQHRLRMDFLDHGVVMIDPDTVYFHHDTFVAPGAVIEPHVFFGPGVKISKGAQIKAFSHIEGAIIGPGAVIGPFARIRPGTEIAADVRIGNFVEVKKSKIGERSKIGHLAYVGDCDMDSDVNFSAGAITVNYDGFEKHKTKIGKGVMVGSNVNLVAPLSIDDGAFIAAGSTITEDVPADALSIGRDTAEIRKGWAAEYRKRKAALVKKLGRKKS